MFILSQYGIVLYIIILIIALIMILMDEQVVRMMATVTKYL